MSFFDYFKRKKRTPDNGQQMSIAPKRNISELVAPEEIFKRAAKSQKATPKPLIKPARHTVKNPDGTFTITQTGASGRPETYTLTPEEYRATAAQYNLPFEGIARETFKTKRLAELRQQQIKDVPVENLKRLNAQQLLDLQLLPGEKTAPSFGLTEENIYGIGKDIAGRSITGAAAAGTAGAAIGGIAGGGVGAVPGALVGAGLGAIGGAASALVAAPNRIQANRDEAIQKGATVRQKEEEIMTDTVSRLNQGLVTPEQAIAELRRSVDNLQTQRAYLKEATTGSFGQKLAKGQDELWEIERVINVDVPAAQNAIREAIITP